MHLIGVHVSELTPRRGRRTYMHMLQSIRTPFCKRRTQQGTTTHFPKTFTSPHIPLPRMFTSGPRASPRFFAREKMYLRTRSEASRVFLHMSDEQQAIHRFTHRETCARTHCKTRALHIQRSLSSLHRTKRPPHISPIPHSTAQPSPSHVFPQTPERHFRCRVDCFGAAFFPSPPRALRFIFTRRPRRKAHTRPGLPSPHLARPVRGLRIETARSSVSASIYMRALAFSLPHAPREKAALRADTALAFTQPSSRYSFRALHTQHSHVPKHIRMLRKASSTYRPLSSTRTRTAASASLFHFIIITSMPLPQTYIPRRVYPLFKHISTLTQMSPCARTQIENAAVCADSPSRCDLSHILPCSSVSDYVSPCASAQWLSHRARHMNGVL